MLIDMTDDSEYTGDCTITSLLWAVPEGGSTWGTMRAALALHESTSSTHAAFSEDNIRSCASDLLQRHYPVFSVGTQGNVYVSSSTEDWDAFIRSWGAVYASLNDYDRADNEEEMAEMLEEYGMMEVIEDETVDAFNERLWLREVEDMMDCLSEDFDALGEGLEVAKTAYLVQTGQAL